MLNNIIAIIINDNAYHYKKKFGKNFSLYLQFKKQFNCLALLNNVVYQPTTVVP